VAALVMSVRNARAVARAARLDPQLASVEWIATAVEMSLYVYMVTGFALSQAYAPILYFLFGLATALRLYVYRQATAESPEAAAEPVRGRSS
jgi:hypothetical protein